MPKTTKHELKRKINEDSIGGLRASQSFQKITELVEKPKTGFDALIAKTILDEYSITDQLQNLSIAILIGDKTRLQKQYEFIESVKKCKNKKMLKTFIENYSNNKG